jgi:TatD DNase family protein
MIIHTRDSFADTFAIVQKFPQIQDRFLFHCFSGNLDELEQVLEFGGRISVGGIVTFKNAETLREIVRNCPMDRLLIETDLPFLAPMPHRGKTCLPEYIDFVAEQIGTIKNLSKQQTWENLQKNSLQFFKKDFV